MNAHPLDRLSDYLDGELEASARRDVETHLDSCAECRAVVADLAALGRGAAEWGRVSQAPAHDLWPGIASRLSGPRATATGDEPDSVLAPGAPVATAPAGAPVVAIASSSAWYRRRWSVGLPELAVAATVLAAVGSALVWSRPPTPGAVAGVAVPAAVVAEMEAIDGSGAAAVPVDFADAQYDAAVIDLERVLLESRDRLDPRTVIVLERNLRVIDDAIREAREALATDPANALLNSHLAGARQRKLDLLRRAAQITEGD